MDRPRVWVGRPLPEAGLAFLRQHAEVVVYPGDSPPPREAILAGVAGCHGLLPLLSDRIDAAVMNAAGPQLKVIANYAVGFDNIDLEAATARGIQVTNTPDVLTETTADLTWALLMAAARRIGEGERFVRAGNWTGWGPLLMLGRDVYGKTLGIVGCGRIGAAVARRGRGFGMRLLYHSRTRRADLEAELGVEYRELPALLPECDYLSLHCPLTPQTRHLVDAAAIATMKPTAILINTTRGAVVDQVALYEALRDGRLFAAGLDVTDPEPPDPADPLLRLENVVIAPHVGSASTETRTEMVMLAARNILAVLRGEPAETPVNRL